MAQNITIMGASYSDVPAVQLPKTGGGTARFDDASITTATASDVLQGKLFLSADGSITTGTGTGGGGGAVVQPLSVTTNGTYTAPSGVDGYSPVTVNVSGGGGGDSAWTKVAETSYHVSTSSTSTGTVATWATGHNEIWTSDKYVLVRITDTAGSRAGYFYGTDTFFLKTDSATATLSNTLAVRFLKYQNASGKYYGAIASSGVFADVIYSNGEIRIRRKYNSNYGTINGTYKVEVYLLDPPTGAPIFT